MVARVSRIEVSPDRIDAVLDRFQRETLPSFQAHSEPTRELYAVAVGVGRFE